MDPALNPSDSKQVHYSRTVLNVVDHLDAMIAYWDRDLICRFANKSYLDWFGVSRDSMIDTVRLNELTGKQFEEIRGFIDGVLAGVPQQFERSIHIPGGEVRFAIVNYYPDFVNGHVNGFIAHTVDISTIKRLEFKLLASEQKFKAILENAPDAVLIMKQSGVIHLFNAQTEKLFGFKQTDLIGQSIDTIIPGVRHKILSLLLTDASQLSGILLLDDLIEFVGVNHEAQQIPLEIRFSPLNLGEEIFIMLSIRDITTRKESERFLSESNNRLQNFTYIVSHNLRSHSTNIQSLLEIFIKQSHEFADNPFIRQMHQSSLNLSETILNLNEVISIANNKDILLQPINLLQTLQAALSNVSQIITDAGVHILLHVSPELTLLGQPAYTDSIMLNFITNAIKYRSPDRLPTITFTASEQQDNIILAIKDNGLGLDLTKYGSRLFGMYKTFHRNKDSKGIGLFISKNQIEAMGGKIEVTSEVNVGSTFSLYFKKSTTPA